MKLLNKLIDFLINYFKISINSNSYSILMLLISLIVSIVYFTGFGITSYINGSIILTFVFIIAAMLSVFNLILIKLKSTIIFSSYFFVTILSLTMLYLVFDSGRNGFGYIWFYLIPIVNVSILGVKRGTIASFLFIITLILAFNLPDYLISTDYFPELKPRLIVSLIAIIVLLFFREWAIVLFKKAKEEEDVKVQNRFNYSKDASIKLSNQVRYASNRIIEEVSLIKEQEYHSEFSESLNSITGLSANIINILNNINDISNMDSISHTTGVEYKINTVINDVIKLFVSQNTKFELTIDKKVPINLYSNQIELKQILYHVIENFISHSIENNDIEIFVVKGAESNDYYEIRYQIVTNIKEKINAENYRSDCHLNELFRTEESHSAKLVEMGLSALEPLVEAVNGSVYVSQKNNALSVCFSQKILRTDKNFRKIIETPTKTKNNKVDSEESVYLKLNNMRVLLMEDNPITQKEIMFVLHKIVKNIDVAENGKHGLALFNKKKYDLILLDLKMPIIDGFEVAEKIRKIEFGTKYRIPIIAVSSLNSKEKIELMLNQGFDAFIEKPLKANELIKKMYKILNAN